LHSFACFATLIRRLGWPCKLWIDIKLASMQRVGDYQPSRSFLMDDSKALSILSALANGVNPLTGEVFGPGSPYQQAEIVRALYVAVDRFKPDKPKARPRTDLPSNVGKPWSDDEDRRLLAEFDRGKRPGELAREFGRTLAGIEARLEKHGRLSARERTTANRYPRDKASGAHPSAS
jgi:hypothetical protein